LASNGGRGLIAGDATAADLFAVSLRVDNDRGNEFDPSLADAVFATAAEESGGFIDINTDSAGDSHSEPASQSESGSQSDSDLGSANSAPTRQALAKLAEQEQQSGGGRRFPGSTQEGGFIELAVTDPHGVARRHPLLDNQTRHDRSSETDGSVGRLIAFDSAGAEAWSAVAASYSITDEAAVVDGTIIDAPQPAAATNMVAVALGAGMMLTSSHMMRHRWMSLATKLLLHAREIASRILRWN